MSRTLLRECLTLLENIIEETSLSDDHTNRAYEMIESIKHELGFVAPVDIYHTLKDADDKGRLNRDSISALSRDLARLINSK